MSEKIQVVAHMTAATGKAEFVREALMGLVAPTRSENGCILYDLCVDADDPSKFTFIEAWTSRAALDAHLKTPHILSTLPLVTPNLAEAPWIQVLKKIS